MKTAARISIIEPITYSNTVEISRFWILSNFPLIDCAAPEKLKEIYDKASLKVLK